MISAHSMYQAGKITGSAYRRHVRDMKGATAQNDGNAPPGAIGDDHIDAHEYQKRGAPGGKASRGGMVGGGPPNVGINHINKKTNKKKFPPGATLRGKGNKLGPVPGEPWKSHPVQPGPLYGGGGRRG